MRSTSLEPTSYYLNDWSIDKSVFRRAVKDFTAVTQQLHELLKPSSTGSTPHGSSPSSQEQRHTSDSREPTIDLGTSETLVEDTIYGNRAQQDQLPMDFQQIQDQINRTVQAAVTAALQNMQPPPGPAGPPGPQGAQGIPGPASNGSASSDRWNPSDLRYFDPHLDKSYGEGEIVTVGKDIYYRNVILFIERLNDVTNVKGATMIKANLNTALRGIALLWYITELSDLKKLGLSVGNGIDE